MKRPFRKWAPAQLKEIFRGERDALSEHERTLLERLCSDDRIRFFWEWLKATEDQDETAVPGAALIFYACVRGLEFPGKPADMPPKEKSKYLSDVRKNAAALKRLLHGTRFDAEIDPSKKKSSGSMQALSGEILDYPFGALTLQLNEVIEWAKKPDRHDISGGPDWMLRHSGLPAKKLFLFFHLRGAFDDFDESPPHYLFADVISVVLDLDGDNPVTVNSIKSMDREIRKRKATKKSRNRRKDIQLMADSVTRIIVKK